jgi:hypothetical protein
MPVAFLFVMTPICPTRSVDKYPTHLVVTLSLLIHVYLTTVMPVVLDGSFSSEVAGTVTAPLTRPSGEGVAMSMVPRRRGGGHSQDLGFSDIATIQQHLGKRDGDVVGLTWDDSEACPGRELARLCALLA